MSDRLHGDVALVAAREIRERTRGRVFRVGTIIILLAVAAGVVIPALHHGSSGSEHGTRRRSRHRVGAAAHVDRQHSAQSWAPRVTVTTATRSGHAPDMT